MRPWSAGSRRKGGKGKHSLERASAWSNGGGLPPVRRGGESPTRAGTKKKLSKVKEQEASRGETVYWRLRHEKRSARGRGVETVGMTSKPDVARSEGVKKSDTTGIGYRLEPKSDSSSTT